MNPERHSVSKDLLFLPLTLKYPSTWLSPLSTPWPSVQFTSLKTNVRNFPLATKLL